MKKTLNAFLNGGILLLLSADSSTLVRHHLDGSEEMTKYTLEGNQMKVDLSVEMRRELLLRSHPQQQHRNKGNH